jgi:hypothetical protein
MKLPFTILTPIFNETKALEFSSFYFDRLGADVRYVLDSQCTPEAAETLRRLGREAYHFDNDQPFIENGYESFCAASPTDWILRIDCDEVPSRELIEACREFVAHDEAGVAGFERHQVLWRDKRLWTATAERFNCVHQRQWRLFNRAAVRFCRTIHTPGIEVRAPVAMAPTAALFHLSWVFLTWEERLAKAARYDRHGQQDHNRTNQLFPLEEAKWKELDAPFLLDALEQWGDQGLMRRS